MPKSYPLPLSPAVFLPVPKPVFPHVLITWDWFPAVGKTAKATLLR